MASKSKNNNGSHDHDNGPDGDDDILSHFISVTGASEEVAKNMLEACNNELDMAIGMYLDSGLAEDSGGGGPSGSRSRSGGINGASGSGSSSTNSSPKRNGGRRRSKTKTSPEDEAYGEDDEDPVRAPIPQKMEQLVDDMVLVNPKRMPSIASTKVRSVFDGFRDFRREAEEQQRAMLAGETSDSSSPSFYTSSSSSTSAAAAFGGKSSKKLKTLEELFRPPVDLLYPGTFIGAREEGKAGNLWLLINIQNHKEFACQCLNRDIWSHGTIRDLVKRHFVFWQVYHDSAEGVKYEQFYPIGQYPYVAILDPRTGERLLTINKFDALSFSETMTEFLREHPSPDGTTNVNNDHRRSFTQSSVAAAAAAPGSAAAASSSSSSSSTSFPSALSPGGKRKRESVVGEDSASSSSSSSAAKKRFTAVAAFESIMDESEDSQLEAAIRASLADSEKSGGNKRKIDVGESLSKNHVAATSKSRTAEKESETTESDEDGVETEGELETFSSSGEEEDDEAGKGARRVKDKRGKAAPSAEKEEEEVVVVEKDDSSLSLDPSNDESVKEDAAVSAASTDDAERWRRWCASEAANEGVAKTKIIFRLPDGARQQTELVADAPLIALTLFVNGQGFPAERFELVTNFPRKKLSYMDGDATLKAVGIIGQETVFVQEREIPLAK